MSISKNLQDMLDYLDKMGANYTLETNPSPEEMERIRKQIAEGERKARMIADQIYNKKHP